MNRLARIIAYWRVRLGHAERIVAPGKWKVYLEGDRLVVEVLE
jgi:hypothetical protein